MICQVAVGATLVVVLLGGGTIFMLVKVTISAFSVVELVSEVVVFFVFLVVVVFEEVGFGAVVVFKVLVFDVVASEGALLVVTFFCRVFVPQLERQLL